MLLCDDTIMAIPNGASGVEFNDREAADYFINNFSAEWEHAVELVSQEQDDWIDQENPATVSETATGKLVLFTPLTIWFMDVYCDTDKGIDAVQNAIMRVKEKYPNTEYRGCIQFGWSDEVGGDVVKFDLSSEDSNEPYSFVGEILKRVVNDKQGKFWEKIRYSNYIQEIEEDLKKYKDWVGDEALNRIAAMSHGKASKASVQKNFEDILVKYHGNYPHYFDFYKKVIDSMNDEQLLECNDFFLEAEKECIWTMEELNEDFWKEDRIKELESKHLKFDPNDRYVSWKYGSSNNIKELVDKDKLRKVITKDIYRFEWYLDDQYKKMTSEPVTKEKEESKYFEYELVKGNEADTLYTHESELRKEISSDAIDEIITTLKAGKKLNIECELFVYSIDCKTIIQKLIEQLSGYGYIESGPFESTTRLILTMAPKDNSKE